MSEVELINDTCPFYDGEWACCGITKIKAGLETSPKWYHCYECPFKWGVGRDPPEVKFRITYDENEETVRVTKLEDLRGAKQ